MVSFPRPRIIPAKKIKGVPTKLPRLTLPFPPAILPETADEQEITNAKREYGYNRGTKTYYDDLEDLTGTGNVWFETALEGMWDIAPESELEEIKMELGADEKGLTAYVDEWHQYVDNEFEKARKNAPDEFGVGSMLSLGVGDGQAWYVVTKVNKKTCQIEWRGFGYDRYVDQFLGYGGRFDVDRIKPLVQRRLALESIFGG
jgi:hypothetical protein